MLPILTPSSHPHLSIEFSSSTLDRPVPSGMLHFSHSPHDQVGRRGCAGVDRGRKVRAGPQQAGSHSPKRPGRIGEKAQLPANQQRLTSGDRHAMESKGGCVCEGRKHTPRTRRRQPCCLVFDSNTRPERETGGMVNGPPEARPMAMTSPPPRKPGSPEAPQETAGQAGGERHSRPNETTVNRKPNHERQMYRCPGPPKPCRGTTTHPTTRARWLTDRTRRHT